MRHIFFLSKKLKQQNDAAFEKESMRTALYFNNAFWLQSLLEENNHRRIMGNFPVARTSPTFDEEKNVDGSIDLRKTGSNRYVTRIETFEMEISILKVFGIVTSFDD